MTYIWASKTDEKTGAEIVDLRAAAPWGDGDSFTGYFNRHSPLPVRFVSLFQHPPNCYSTVREEG